jgi:hypothetical protein
MDVQNCWCRFGRRPMRLEGGQVPFKASTIGRQASQILLNYALALTLKRCKGAQSLCKCSRVELDTGRWVDVATFFTGSLD